MLICLIRLSWWLAAHDDRFAIHACTPPHNVHELGIFSPRLSDSVGVLNRTVSSPLSPLTYQSAVWLDEHPYRLASVFDAHQGNCLVRIDDAGGYSHQSTGFVTCVDARSSEASYVRLVDTPTPRTLVSLFLTLRCRCCRHSSVRKAMRDSEDDIF